MTLTEFLLARIAEDGAEADHVVWDAGGGNLEPYHERVLAECEAKRQIVEYTEATPSCPEHDTRRADGCRDCYVAEQVALYDQQILRRLSLPYADHPDYREEWRP